MLKQQQHQFESNLRTLALARDPISQQECVELLAQVPLFCELSRRELRQLSDAAIQRDYPAGTTMIRQGETGVGFYVLIRGHARIQQRLADGSDRELATLGRGEIFGEMALIDMFPRSASVMALEETSALVIPIVAFRALLYNEPNIAMKLLAVLALRVQAVESTASL